MEKIVTSYWWVFVLRGILAVLFGLAAVSYPGLTLEVFILFFAIFVFIEGIFAIVGSVGNRSEKGGSWTLLDGIAGVLFGVITFSYPGLTAMLFLILIALWALLSGVFKIITAIHLRKEVKGEWRLGLSGILSVLFGLFLIAQPAAGALALVWVIGLFALFEGLLLIYLGVKFKSHPKPSEA